MASSIITQVGPSSSDLGSSSPSSASISYEKHLNWSTRTLEVPEPENRRQNSSPPSTLCDNPEKWNQPGTLYRVLAAYFSYLIFGMNDGSYGAMIPLLSKYYGLNYTIVSLVFLSPFVGYLFSSFINNWIHIKLGQRGVAIIAPLIHVLAYVVLALHPPYVVLVIVFVFVGFGNGLLTAAWSAWMGAMDNANEVSGALSGCYTLGATIAPLIATAFVDKAGMQWFGFYYLMIGVAILELVSSVWAFWGQTGLVYRQEHPKDTNGMIGQALRQKLTWVFSLFIFGYVGAEVSLGGWIITFMTKLRNANSVTAAAASTGFWAGMTAGRFCLSFLTARLGEHNSILLYLALSLALELVFWLVPNLIVSAITVSFLGFFLGPIFPCIIVIITKLLPKELQMSVVGFAGALGGVGGAIWPFIVGAVAQSRGVGMLQPFVLALLAGISGLFWLIPRSAVTTHKEATTSRETV